MGIRKSISGNVTVQKRNIKTEFVMMSVTSLNVFGMVTIVTISDQEATISLIQGPVSGKGYKS